MAIVIKEIILSDSVSKFMEKVNFNFDQLLLAGGGPPGPIGPIGLAGPAGPKGDPGNKWYVGCTISPTGVYNAGAVMTGITAFEGDLFLQNQDCVTLQDWPLGQVLEFNELTQEWDNTGLNIEGPTGPTGATGTSIEFIMFPGFTNAYSAWAPQQTVGSGSEANYVFLKGDVSDTMGGLAGRDGGSRDILYLGGHRAAMSKQSEWSWANTPKLIVNPKNGYNIVAGPTTAPGFFWGASAGGGVAGGGIAMGWELPQNDAIGPSATTGTMSWSNMFVDDLHNLHLTNFTNFNAASQNTDGTASNIINISGMARTELHGAGYTATNVTGHVGVGMNLQTDAYSQMGIGNTDWDGALMKSGGTNDKVTLQTEEQGMITIAGGGNYLAQSLNPNVMFVSDMNGLSNNDVDTYRISLSSTPPTNFNSTTDTGAKEPFLQSGFVSVDSSDRKYIGLGAGVRTGSAAPAKPTISAVNVVLTDHKILIGEPTNANADDVFGSVTINTVTGIGGGFEPNSLDIMGRLRMREAKTQYLTGTTGDVMIAVDSSGVAGWTASSNVGGWKADPQCTSRLIVSQQGVRFPSTIAGDSTGPVGELNYSRMDVAVNNGGPSNPAAEADLFFTTYEDPSQTKQYGVQYNFGDTQNQGQISIRSYTTVNECPSNLTSQDATGSVGILQGDYYGRIIIGQSDSGDEAGSWVGTGSELAYNRSLTIESNTTRTNNETISSIVLRNLPGDMGALNFGSPQLTFSPGFENQGANGFDDATTFEVHRDTRSSEALGDYRIRFQGVAAGQHQYADSNQEDGVNGLTTIVGASGGANVLMISDSQGATSMNDEVARTPHAFEADHRDFFIDRIRTFWRTNATSSSSDRDQEYRVRLSRCWQMYEWGTSNSGWDQQLQNFTVFNGSRMGSDFDISGAANDTAPYAYFTDNSNCLAIAASGKATANSQRVRRLNTWHSPMSIIRFTPINMTAPNPGLGDGGIGLAWFEFDIQMGMFFTGGNANGYDDCVAANPNQYTYVPLNGPGSNYNDYGISDDPKIQYFRVKLKSHALKKLAGPDGKAIPSLKQNPTYPSGQNSYGSGGALTANQKADSGFRTQWYTGAVKPMFGIGDANTTNTNLFVDTNTGNAQNRYPWGSGILRWEEMGGGTNYSAAGAGVQIFNNMTINPTSANWGGNQITTLDLNMGSGVGRLTLAGDRLADYAGRFTSGQCLWRINQTFDSNGNITGSFLEIYYPPQQYDGWQTQVVPGKDGTTTTEALWTTSRQRAILPSRMGYQNGTNANGDTSTDPVEWANNYGWVPNTPCFQDTWSNACGAKAVRVSTEALMTCWSRRFSFYQAMGISFSGGNMVRYSNEEIKTSSGPSS